MDFKFYTNDAVYSVETKDNGEKSYYVTGHISTADMDLVNDIVTDKCMDDMLVQIKSGNIKLDVEHEAFKDGAKKINKIPIARIVDAKRDSKGIYIKALINDSSPDFKSVWGSLKNRFLDAFSITYKAIDYINKVIDGVTVRLLNKITLLNVALTGNPVNPHATMDKVFIKSLEESIMTDELNNRIAELERENLELKAKLETKSEEDNEKSDSKPEDEAEAEGNEKQPEAKAEAEDKENESEVKSRLDKLEAENAELKAIMNKPQFKSLFEKAPEPSEPKKPEVSINNILDIL